ncbi:hypothetical protein KAR91_62370 [Candidatus Pacearchaeota archaeon]|nr:hypothetical protein [Candidatus Pacearchaeota archaeon]
MVEGKGEPREEDKSMHKYIELYKQVFAVERKKSGIYSNLWTILIGTVTALLGLYYHSKNFVLQPQSAAQAATQSSAAGYIHGEIYILVIPFLFIIWGAFIIFNYLYLQATRNFLKDLEEKIFPGEDEKKYHWFNKVYEEKVKRKAAPFLYILAGATLIVSFAFIIILCVQELKTPVARTNYLWTLAAVAVMGIIIYLISFILYLIKRIKFKV